MSMTQQERDAWLALRAQVVTATGYLDERQRRRDVEADPAKRRGLSIEGGASMKTTAVQAKEIMERLGSIQGDGTSYPCPRCGLYSMKEKLTRNALSRHAKVYICPECGTSEALLDFVGKPLPLAQWALIEALDVVTEDLPDAEIVKRQILEDLYSGKCGGVA